MMVHHEVDINTATLAHILKRNASCEPRKHFTIPQPPCHSSDIMSGTAHDTAEEWFQSEFDREINAFYTTELSAIPYISSSAECDMHPPKKRPRKERQVFQSRTRSDIFERIDTLAAAKKEPLNNLHELIHRMNDEQKSNEDEARAVFEAACGQDSTSVKEENEQDNDTNVEKPERGSLISQDTIPSSSGRQSGIALVQPGNGIVNSNSVFEEICETLGGGDQEDGRRMMEQIGLSIAARLQWKAAVSKAQKLPPTVEFCERIPSGNPRMMIQGCALYFDNDVLLNIDRWQYTGGVESADNVITLNSQHEIKQKNVLHNDTHNANVKQEGLQNTVDTPLPLAMQAVVDTATDAAQVQSAKPRRAVFESRGTQREVWFKAYDPSVQKFT